MIHDFRGKTLVSIREFYKKGGKELPSARGDHQSKPILSSCFMFIFYFSPDHM